MIARWVIRFLWFLAGLTVGKEMLKRAEGKRRDV